LPGSFCAGNKIVQQGTQRTIGDSQGTALRGFGKAAATDEVSDSGTVFLPGATVAVFMARPASGKLDTLRSTPLKHCGTDKFLPIAAVYAQKGEREGAPYVP